MNVFLHSINSHMSIGVKILCCCLVLMCIGCTYYLWSKPAQARTYVKMTGTTELESRFFKDLRDRRMNQWSTADAFFIASGIRQMKDLKKARQWLQDVTQKAKQALRPYRSTENKADHLLRWLHQNAFSRYQASATDALQLIHNGKFNCLSSCILYGIIGQSLGLKVNGIAVDQHAFCKVYAQRKGRKAWDVETTTPLGFNPGRNVKISNAVVSVPRNQYRNRREMKILDMIGLIYTNHVGLTGAFPSTEDKLLAYQKAALFLPKDPIIAHNIIAAHTQIIQQAQQRGRWKDAQAYLQALASFDRKDKYHTALTTELWNAHSHRLNTQHRFQQSIQALKGYQAHASAHLQVVLNYLLGKSYALWSQHLLKKRQNKQAEKQYRTALSYGKKAEPQHRKYRRKYRGNAAQSLKLNRHNYWVAVKNNLVYLHQNQSWDQGADWTRKAQKVKSKDSELNQYAQAFQRQLRYDQKRQTAYKKQQNLQQDYQSIIQLTQQEKWQEAMDLLQDVMPRNKKDAKPFRELYQKLDPIIKGQKVVDLVNEGEYKQAHQVFRALQREYRRNKNVKALAKMMKTVPRR